METAKAKHKRQLERIDEAIDAIRFLIAVERTDVTDPTWSDAATMQRTANELTELADWLGQTGEYAEVK